MEGIPGYNAHLTGPTGVTSTAGDQEKAKQLLQQGLQEEGYASVTALPPISLSYYISYKAGVDTVLAIADEWKQVLGVSVRLVGMSIYQLMQAQTNTVGNNSLQMWYWSGGATYPDPQSFMTFFFGKGSAYNSFNYGQNGSSDASAQQAVQDELARADTEQDSSKRLKMYQDAEQHIVNDVGMITTYQSAYLFSVNPKLHNWKLTPLGFLATNDWYNIYFVQ
jgi:oligopeptide transport system substrate-binding protein